MATEQDDRMTVIERYKLAAWESNGTIAGFYDDGTDVNRAGLRFTHLVKAEDYDALAEQIQGAVGTLRAIQAICDDTRNTADDVRFKVEHALTVGVTPGLNAGGQ